MKKIHFIIPLLILIASCGKDDEYPFEQSPYIEFEGLTFYDKTGTNESHILETSFIVWDIEGDVGLTDKDFEYPYHQYDVILDGNDQLIQHDDPFNPPFKKVPGVWNGNSLNDLQLQLDYSEEVELDSYPDLDCEDYIISGEFGVDEFLGKINKNFYNLRLSFFDSNQTPYNFREIFGVEAHESCDLGEFDGRILPISEADFLNPIENHFFEIEKLGQYSYKITYSLQSRLWKLAFLDNNFEVKIQVIDRALNQSNIASSDIVRLVEITEQ